MPTVYRARSQARNHFWAIPVCHSSAIDTLTCTDQLLECYACPVQCRQLEVLTLPANTKSAPSEVRHDNGSTFQDHSVIKYVWHGFKQNRLTQPF